MLYELMMSLKGFVPGANLFSYITFRAGGAVMTALIISFILGPWVIDNLRMRQGKGQPIREDGPQSHLVTKVGTLNSAATVYHLRFFQLIFQISLLHNLDLKFPISNFGCGTSIRRF